VGEGKKLSSLPEYADLKSQRARLHKAGAEIVRGANAGEKVARGAHREFTLASNAVVLDISAYQARRLVFLFSSTNQLVRWCANRLPG